VAGDHRLNSLPPQTLEETDMIGMILLVFAFVVSLVLR
jgi:hypothetical protein